MAVVLLLYYKLGNTENPAQLAQGSQYCLMAERWHQVSGHRAGGYIKIQTQSLILVKDIGRVAKRMASGLSTQHAPPLGR